MRRVPVAPGTCSGRDERKSFATGTACGTDTTICDVDVPGETSTAPADGAGNPDPRTSASRVSSSWSIGSPVDDLDRQPSRRRPARRARQLVAYRRSRFFPGDLTHL